MPKTAEEKAAYKADWAKKHAVRLKLKRAAYYVENKDDILTKQAAYYAANPEPARERARQWREDNPERKSETDKRYAQENAEAISEYQAGWRAEHVEERRDYAANYHIDNAEELCERARQWVLDNPAQAKASRQAWREANPEKKRAYDKRRKALKRGAERSDFTEVHWQMVQQAFGDRCAYCHIYAPGELTQDHLTPLSQGGNHTLHNIVPACQSCNSRKHAGPVPVPVQPLLL